MGKTCRSHERDNKNFAFWWSLNSPSSETFEQFFSHYKNKKFWMHVVSTNKTVHHRVYWSFAPIDNWQKVRVTRYDSRVYARQIFWGHLWWMFCSDNKVELKIVNLWCTRTGARILITDAVFIKSCGLIFANCYRSFE